MLLLITGFACSIITARLLGPEANGIIAFSLWFATTGALVAELGTGVMLLRMLPQLKAHGYNHDRRRGFAAFLVTPTLVSTLILLGLYIAFFIASEDLHWAKTAPTIAAVTGILFVIQSIGAFAKNYLIGEQRLSEFFRLTGFASVLQLVAVLVGAIYFGVEGALIGYACSQAVLFVYTLKIIVHRRDKCDVPVKFLLSSSLVLSLEFVVDSIFLNRIELLFLQQFWSVKMVGFYAVGLSVANLALQLPVQLTGSLLPFYSEQRHTSESGALSPNVFAGVIRAIAYVTLPMSFGLAAISTPLVTLVFGEAFRPSGNIVMLLAIAAPPFVFMQILTQYLFSVDRARDRLWVGLAGAAVMVVGCLALVPWLGGVGAALARVTTFVVMCLLLIWITGFARSLGGLYATLLKVALASMVSGFSAYCVLEYVSSSALGMVAALLAGFFGYILALRIFGAVPVQDAEIMTLISGRLPGLAGKTAGRFIHFVAPRFGRESALAVQAPQSKKNQVGAAIHAAGVGRAASMPVTFEGTVGLFQAEDEDIAKRDCAVLFLSPWGFEEMCARKFYRIQAEHLAARGIASLRFDYPGTGDSLEVADFTSGLDVWENAIIAAAEKLRQLSGCKKIILVGQGLGGCLAHKMAGQLGNVHGVAMLAPVLSGRTYLREVAIWSKMVDAGLGLRDDQRDTDGVSIAGLKMPEDIANAVRKLNISAVEHLPTQHYLFMERPARGNENEFPDALGNLGAEVQFEVFHGYDELVSNPTIARMPMQVVDIVGEWAENISNSDPDLGRSTKPELVTPLYGDGFIEIPVRFGIRNHLYGMLTRPTGKPKGAPMLVLTTAYDRHAGWGRMGVNTARDMARLGIVSLRYDAANVGDSPPAPEAPSQIIYSDSQGIDVSDALDLLLAYSTGPAVIAGRCSGGYQAFRSGIVDERIKAIVSINPYVLFWDPDRSVDDTLMFAPRSLDDYGQRIIQLGTLKRLVTGQINLKAALWNIVIAAGRKLARFAAPLIERLPGRLNIGKEIRASFALLQKRKVPVTLIYSEGDVGVDQMQFYFGLRGKKLEAHANVKLIMLPDTDHNLTPLKSREKVFAELLAVAGH